MSVGAVSPRNVSLLAGGLWELVVETRDLDGELVDTAPTLTVTNPAGTTTSPAWETVSAGVLRATVLPAVAGRWIATVVDATYGAVDFGAYVALTTAAGAMPVAADVVAYMGGTSWENADVEDALAAEAAAQRARCRVAAVYPDDLREALLRRVLRNLALRSLPLATVPGDGEGSAPMPVPHTDPEVRRLEAPHRKLTVG